MKKILFLSLLLTVIAYFHDTVSAIDISNNNASNNKGTQFSLSYKQHTYITHNTIAQSREENPISPEFTYNLYKATVIPHNDFAQNISYVFFGIMLAFLFISIVFSFTTRIKEYIYITLLIACFTILSLLYAKIHTISLFPLHTIIDNKITSLIVIVCILFFYTLFSKELLVITKYTKQKTALIIQLLLSMCIGMLVVCIFSSYDTSSIFLGIFLAGTSIVLLYISFIQLQRQRVTYTLHFISTILFTIFSFIISLSLTNYLQLGSFPIWYLIMSVILAFCGILMVCIATHIIKNKKEQLFSKNNLIDNAKQIISQQRETMYAYNRFMPKTNISFFNKKHVYQLRSGESIQQPMSVMCIGIENFPHIISTLETKDTAQFLSVYHEHVHTVITQDSGYAHNDTNGNIIALFKEHAPVQAIGVAEQMIQTKEILQKAIAHYTSSNIDIKLCIGITIGNVALGIIGKENTGLQATLLSNEGIISSRLQKINTLFKTECIISKSAYAMLPTKNSYAVRILPTIFIKGLEKEKGVYELFESDPPEMKFQKKALLNHYNNAITLLYRNKLPESISLLEIYQKKYPHDRTVKTLLMALKKQAEILKLRY